MPSAAQIAIGVGLAWMYFKKRGEPKIFVESISAVPADGQALAFTSASTGNQMSASSSMGVVGFSPTPGQRAVNESPIKTVPYAPGLAGWAAVQSGTSKPIQQVAQSGVVDKLTNPVRLLAISTGATAFRPLLPVGGTPSDEKRNYQNLGRKVGLAW